MQPLISSQKLWILHNSLYHPGAVISRSPSSKHLSIKLDSNEILNNISEKDCRTRSNKPKNHPDMCSMETLNQPEIVSNLMLRYENSQIYTNIGSTLIAINPYREIKGLYGKESIQRVRNWVLNREGKQKQEIEPHVYVTAGNAFTKLRNGNKKQALIISGESGAGKTENMKHCMKFITALSHSRIKRKFDKPIQDIILQSNPILECFGNAKTVRNNNSSRFGKFVKLFISEGSLIGAKIQNYLLEKSRVTSVAKKERTFHVFYCLNQKKNRGLAGLQEGEKFQYLEVGTMKAEGINDMQDFEELKMALKDIGLNEKQIQQIFMALGGILLLGNLKFSDTENSKNPNINCTYQDLNLPIRISRNLSLTIQQLNNILLQQKRYIGKQLMVKRYNKTQCTTNRNTFSKALYSRIFDYLIQKINIKLFTNSDQNQQIGILDIFGFEMFDKNSFEQLCINFTNQRLQKLYTKYIFESEIEELKKDGLGDKIKNIVPSDNRQIIELIQKRVGISIFSLIDQKTALGAAKDQDIIAQLRKIKSKNLYVDTEPNKTKFMILHTQSPVIYDVTQFKFKNQDSITQQIESTLDKLFPIEKNNDEKGKTLVTKFDKQLRLLNDELESSELHFIRCIKPNHTKTPMELDQKYALQQIKYMGVLETILIRKNTFPFRLYYQNFIDNYRCLVNVRDRKEFEKLMKVEQCVGILRRVFPGIEKDKNGYQLGNQKIYLKQEHEKRLTQLLLKYVQKVNQAAVVIQNSVKKYHQRKMTISNLKRFIKKMKLLRKVVTNHAKSTKRLYFLKYSSQAKQQTQLIKTQTKLKSNKQKLVKLKTILTKLSPVFQKYQRFIFFYKLKFTSQQAMYQTITQYSTTYIPESVPIVPRAPTKKVVESLLSPVSQNYQSVVYTPNIKSDIAFKGQIQISPYDPKKCKIQKLMNYITHLVLYKEEDKQPWMSIDVNYNIQNHLKKQIRAKLENFIYIDFYESTLRKKRTVFGKYKKAIENLQYKGEPMKSSLLILSPDEQKIALQIFKTILTIGEQPKLHKICQQIETILDKIKNGSQTLKDQIFVQLLKQQNHTNEYFVIKMYQLTAILLHCQQISSNHLQAALSCYIERSESAEVSHRIKQYIHQTFPKLLRQYQNKNTSQQLIRYFPAKYQIMALMSRRQISVSIFLSVGQQLVIYVQNFDTFADIKQRVCLKAGINLERFINQILTFIELINYENMDMKENPIDENRRVWDLLTEWQLTFSQYEQVCKKPPVFIIMMKLKYPFELSSNDLEGIQLVYAQCYFDLFLGKLHIPLDLLYQNSAIMKTVQPQTQLHNIIPLIYMKDQQTKQKYISTVTKMISNLSGKSRAQLRFKFIKNCQSDCLCMASFYSTQSSLKIYVKLKKVILVDEDNQRGKQEISIRKIIRWSIQGNLFILVMNEGGEKSVEVRIREEYGKILSQNLRGNMNLVRQIQGIGQK